MTATAIDWPAFRARFPIVERCVYLNTGWSGPSARSVVEAIQQRVEREAFEGPTSPEIRHEKALLIQGARAGLASMIGVGQDDVALLGSTTEGVNLVLHGLGLGPGDEVITCNLEHSSVIVPCYDLRRQAGVDVAIVRSSARESADELAQLFADAMSRQTKLVVISHISYNRGTRLPLDRIVRAAHDAGALVLVDGAQSAGQIAVDVGALDVDAYAYPGHKYLLGPDGIGALYLKPELIERIEPAAVAHGASIEYDFEGNFRPRLDSMRRFEMATHSGPLAAGVIEATTMLRKTGIEAIEPRLLALAGRARDGLGRIAGVTVRTPDDPELRSALVAFTVDALDPNETCAALWQLRRIVARVVGDRRVRLSFAPFNDESDVDAALEAVEQLAREGLPPNAMSATEYKAQLLEDFD